MQQPVEMIKTIFFPKATRKAIQAILELHSARLEEHDQEERCYCLIRFPEGTRRERTKVLAYHERYLITLPDGFEVLQTVDQEGWSTLRFAVERG